MKKRNQHGGPRETRRVIERRPWGRKIVVDNTPFMWRVAGPTRVIIRTENGYHEVSSYTLSNGSGWFDMISPTITPSDVANWIRSNLLTSAL